MLIHDFSDEQLCLLLKQGEERALDAILLRYWQPMYQMAAKTLKDVYAAEDIVQDIFVRIWDSRAKITFKHTLKAYLFASTRYGIYRHIRKVHLQEAHQQAQDFQYIEHYNPENELECKELMENVAQIVNSLPSRCREVYDMSRNDQLNHREIAELLNISTKTVENQITIALKRIRIGLGKVILLLIYLF